MSPEICSSSLRNEQVHASRWSTAGDKCERERGTRLPTHCLSVLTACWTVLLLNMPFVAIAADSVSTSPAASTVPTTTPTSTSTATATATATSSSTQAAPSSPQPATSEPQTQDKKPASSDAGLRMQVTGIEDAPRVLSIVPWKSLTTPVSGPTFPPLAEDVWSPVEPASFRRELQYFERVRARGPEPQPPAGEQPERQ